MVKAWRDNFLQAVDNVCSWFDCCFDGCLTMPTQQRPLFPSPPLWLFFRDTCPISHLNQFNVKSSGTQDFILADATFLPFTPRHIVSILYSGVFLRGFGGVCRCTKPPSTMFSHPQDLSRAAAKAPAVPCDCKS